MDTDTINFILAILSAGFWLPIGILLILKRHALTVLASLDEGPTQNWPKVTVVIPARNEERNVNQALQSVLRLDYPDLQIVVVNDRSTDGTGSILKQLAEQDPRLTLMHIQSLPDGWLGKTHALHMAARQALGEFILFTDADIVFHPLALRKAMSHVQANRLDHLTVVPEDTMPGFFLRSLSATFGIFMFMLFQPWRVRNPKSRRYMGIGAFNLVRTSVYRAIGGHQAIALRPDDDLKLGKLVKLNGFRADVLNGQSMVTVEWYRSVPELIQGLMKNMYAGMEYRLSLVILATIGSLLFHIWPWIGMWVTTGVPQILYALTVLMMVGSFGIAMAPHGVKPWQGLLLPLTISLLVYIQCRATILTLWQGGIYWRETFYTLKALKNNKV
ncbi:glycosyltransferase [Candidatus Nitronereus thalassa]|uniref:Glycosyltransferase n=1 Tax=Candidatus Nitronereus thalassa TaxID=3020898 RepID=A0ABU3K9A0_9BACT|nr:glycosyltransferase [Candidatus Nitronereus thalassa]MDT7042939.1 glycosyltransferase [Candidatus Nitronereus thalassa]